MPLTRPIQDLIESVDGLKGEVRRKTFTTRIAVGLAGLLAAIALVVGGLGIVQIHSSNVARCEAGNEFRKADRARWEYIIHLAPPPTTQDALDRLHKFQGYIATADALRHC